jgi:hypothetical protein
MFQKKSHHHCILTAFLSLAAITMAATGVSAETLTYPVNILLPYSSSCSVPQFNPAMGTLQSVTLEAHASFSNALISYITIENLNPSQGGNVSISYSTMWQVSGPDSLGVGGGSYSTVPGYVGAFDGNYDGYGPDSFTVGVLSNPGFGTTTINSGFSDYVGLGNVWIQAFAFYTPSFSGDPGLSLMAYGGGMGGTMGMDSYGSNLTYTYTTAPEPSTLVLLGIDIFGLVGFSCRRRRR